MTSFQNGESKNGSLASDASLVQCMYFENNSLGLSSPAFKELWEKLGIFGELWGTGYMWESGSTPCSRPRKLRLGAVEDIQGICTNPTSVIVGGAGFSNRKFASGTLLGQDLSFGNDSASSWAGVDIPPRSTICVTDAWIKKVGFPAVLEILRTHIALADSSMPIYGFVDYSDSRDVLYGSVFSSVTYLETPFHRWVEQSRWLQRGIDKGQLRSVYWGNYLSRAHLRKLGGEEFLARLRKTVQAGSGDSSAHVWEFENGVFISVNVDPTLGCGVGGRMTIQTVNTLNWLIDEFCNSDLL